MSSVFAALLLVSLVGLAWGLIAPHHLVKTAKVKKPVTRKHIGILFGCLIILFVALTSVTAPPQAPNKLQKANLTTSTTSTQPQANTVTTKQVTETQPVAFKTTNQNDGNLPKGQRQVALAGKDGTETLTFIVTYTNGLQTDKTLTKTVVTTQPVNEIDNLGTYVAPTPSVASTPVPTTSVANCTNGTYVNSSGNTVCSPETSSTQPAGATAKCVDGTYSFSQHHSGTCSYHGGVALWL